MAIRYRALSLRPGEAFRVEQTFLAGQRARVGVAAGVDPFILSVTSDGRPLPCRTAPVARSAAETPAWTTRVTIGLKNTGAKPGKFYLVMH
ncbi:MAG: hypothetical protein JWN21_2021 [Sphingomonas bacterium]|uniref:hypothetical protein n=1 Tax=Sphingomonas bacterium TaxID=1895847 RepID=UPI00263602CF|nr:hypothetical protein [Sphingomonas bacterium]MDB5696478.1 hypothetical protein [Sphingomonas bacterium]